MYQLDEVNDKPNRNLSQIYVKLSSDGRREEMAKMCILFCLVIYYSAV